MPMAWLLLNIIETCKLIVKTMTGYRTTMINRGDLIHMSHGRNVICDVRGSDEFLINKTHDYRRS
jgi:hypothetical protein